jgi:DNA-binding MarR family transcriptional regulator
MPAPGGASAAVAEVLRHYPRIFFACHQRHVRDPATRRLVSAQQASILDHLDPVDPIALNDLARHMGVTAGTMSVTVDRLVQKGYVRRSRATADLRRVELRITDAGLRLREQQSVLEPALVQALLEQLSPEEAAEGIRGLQILARAANALVAQRSKGGAAGAHVTSEQSQGRGTRSPRRAR